MASLIKLVKYLLLSKIAVYIMIAVMILAGLSAWTAASSRSYGYGSNPNAIALAITAMISFAPYFIASAALSAHLAKKYRRFLKKGKSTTVDHIAASLNREDVDSLKSELQLLIDRGYLPGIVIDEDTNRISQTAVKDTVQELGRTVKKTVSAFKDTSLEAGTSASVCKKCGAAIPDDGSTNCEFCGAPIPR